MHVDLVFRAPTGSPKEADGLVSLWFADMYRRGYENLWGGFAEPVFVSGRDVLVRCGAELVPLGEMGEENILTLFGGYFGGERARDWARWRLDIVRRYGTPEGMRKLAWMCLCWLLDVDDPWPPEKAEARWRRIGLEEWPDYFCEKALEKVRGLLGLPASPKASGREGAVRSYRAVMVLTGRDSPEARRLLKVLEALLEAQRSGAVLPFLHGSPYEGFAAIDLSPYMTRRPREPGETYVYMNLHI